MSEAGERRTGPRIPIEMWVEETASKHELYFQRSGNLSVGGIFLENTIPHPLGTVVELEFVLPGDTRRLKVRGEIVNLSDAGHFGMGIKFVGVDPATHERIARFVEAEAQRVRPQAQ